MQCDDALGRAPKEELRLIEIGVEIGSDSQVGALSFVPEYTKLKGGAVYAGTEVQE